MERWEAALEGEGQVVLLAGEPGIGKSRLAEELIRASSREERTTLRFQSSPYHASSALFPFVNQLRQAMRVEASDETEQRLDKLETVIETVENRAHALALFASLLSLPVERYGTLGLTPQERKAQTLLAIRAQLEAMVERRPVVALFEDAHWMDPTSREVLDSLIPVVERMPVLLVITHRPQFESPWSAYGHVTHE